MFPQRKFYRYFFSVVILLGICALLQIVSINFLNFSNRNSQSLYRKTSVAERTRGVREEERHFYILNNENTFRCRDGSNVIRLNQVNDDYCDCQQDGSDEPGTEACPNGRFFCLPEDMYMPSSRVNDGICDCCDGSDEWRAKVLSPMGNARDAPCTDTCREIQDVLEKKRRVKRDGQRAKEEYLEAGKPYIGLNDGLYGRQGEFYLLSQECFYYKKEKLRYTLCPFKENMQESGGNSFLIGAGGRWSTDPRTGENILVMNGGERSRCPQGKKRQTRIKFVCGLKNEILSLSENELCIYTFQLSTPAAC